MTDEAPRAGWAVHAQGIALLLIMVALVVGLVVVLPRKLKEYAREDLRGVPQQKSPGIVISDQITPGNNRGGGAYNAVVLSFAGRKAYWDLPPTSQWAPKINEPVVVTYRVGRHPGHIVHIDGVAWGSAIPQSDQ